MSSARQVCGLWLLGVLGCDGPVLNAGSHVLELDASEESDARTGEDEDDDSDEDAGRGRDVWQGDGGERFTWLEERRPCGGNPRVCLDNEHLRRCSPAVWTCVECFDEEQCASGRCSEFGVCAREARPPTAP